MASGNEYDPNVADELSAGSQSSLRARNTRLVLRTLSRFGPLARVEIADRTTLSPATVSNIVAALVAEGAVTVDTGQRSGRRAKVVRLSGSADKNVSLGLAVGQGVISGALCDAAGNVVVSADVKRAASATYRDELSILAGLVSDFRTRPEVGARFIVGVGVSIATWVDFDRGCIPPDLNWYGFEASPSWRGAPLREDLSSLCGLPVHVDSDGNTGALAESRWGAGRGQSNVVYVRIRGDGVTGALLLNNRLYRGEAGLAGSFGHSTADPSGSVCKCGSRGCLETFLDADALLEPLRRSYGSGLTLRDVAELAAQGDHGCSRIVADAAEQLGRALSNTISVLAPGCIVIAGDLAPANGVLTQALDRSLTSLMPSMFRPGAILMGQFNDGEALGAAALAFEEEEAWSSAEAPAAPYPDVLKEEA
jgi:predicted NBD/HSP70 family sugar kinase